MALIIIPSANAAMQNLITNGDFETGSAAVGNIHGRVLSELNDGGKFWDVYDVIPGWTTAYGKGIEVQCRKKRGGHHVELDSHGKPGNSAMIQNLSNLVAGEEYELDFLYRARTNNLDDNGIFVYWYEQGESFDYNGGVIAYENIAQGWHNVNFTLTATSADMVIGFGSYGDYGFVGGNTLDAYLDDISLTGEVAPIPVPAAAWLFGSALMGLGLAKRRK